jgi:hypothetical protein
MEHCNIGSLSQFDVVNIKHCLCNVYLGCDISQRKIMCLPWDGRDGHVFTHPILRGCINNHHFKICLGSTLKRKVAELYAMMTTPLMIPRFKIVTLNINSHNSLRFIVGVIYARIAQIKCQCFVWSTYNSKHTWVIRTCYNQMLYN